MIIFMEKGLCEYISHRPFLYYFVCLKFPAPRAG